MIVEKQQIIELLKINNINIAIRNIIQDRK